MKQHFTLILQEQEARTDLLRARAKSKFLKPGGDSNLVTYGDKSEAGPALEENSSSLSHSKKDVSVQGLSEKREHINFFKDIEDGVSHLLVNVILYNSYFVL